MKAFILVETISHFEGHPNVTILGVYSSKDKAKEVELRKIEEYTNLNRNLGANINWKLDIVEKEII